MSFDTHSKANLPLLPILEKNQFFFSKKPIVFTKKPVSRIMRNLTISVAFYGKFGDNLVLKKFHGRTPDSFTNIGL